MDLENFYTSVFDQCSSPCAKFLACCSNFARISIFNLQDAVSTTNEIKKPHFSFKISKVAYCLVTCEDLLVCGLEDGEIRLFAWEDLINKNSNPINILPSQNKGDVGSMCVMGSSLITSHGSVLHQWDINNNFKLLDTLEGHTDHIHTVQKHQGLIYSGSEDGSVVSWDARSGSRVAMLVPSSDPTCQLSEEAGKWVKSVALAEDKDYLVVGGGFKMSLWYPGYKTATTIFNHDNVPSNQHINGLVNGDGGRDVEEMEVNEDIKGVPGGGLVSNGITNHIIVNNGTLLSCGDSSEVSTWATNGTLLSTLPCSPFNLYNIHVNQQSPKLLTVAGSSSDIDACINYNYRSFAFAMV